MIALHKDSISTFTSHGQLCFSAPNEYIYQAPDGRISPTKGSYHVQI